MIINEIVTAPAGYQDISNDKSAEYGLRKTRLTLLQINKLRKMNDIREYEQIKKLDSIQAQYKNPSSEGGEDSPF